MLVQRQPVVRAVSVPVKDAFVLPAEICKTHSDGAAPLVVHRQLQQQQPPIYRRALMPVARTATPSPATSAATTTPSSSPSPSYSPSPSPRISPACSPSPRVSAETRRSHPLQREMGLWQNKFDNVLLMLRNGMVLVQCATIAFQRFDTDNNGVLSMNELEVAIPQLVVEFGLSLPENSEEQKKMVQCRIRKFDVNGDGSLSLEEFVELYKWHLWRQYEILKPPNFERKSQIEVTKKGVPSQIYTIGKELGKGAFGIAYSVRHKQTNVERVMKTVNKQKAMESGSPLTLIHQEIDLLAMLDHPHILKLYEHYHDHSNVYIVTGVCHGGELLDIVEDHAKKQKPLPEAWIARVFGQVLEAIGYCHSKGIMHKDLKFENVMLEHKVTAESPIEQIHAIVIDVGLAELFGQQHGKSARSDVLSGSVATMAPEVVARNCSCKCDIWSLGIMLFAIFNAVPQYISDGKGGQTFWTYPFFATPLPSDPFGLAGLVAAQRAGPPLQQIQHASFDAQFSIQKMLMFSEDLRPSAQEAHNFPFFCNVDSRRAVELSHQQVNSLTKQRDEKMWWNAMISAAASQIPATQVMHLSDVFRSIDSNGDGFIEKSDLSARLQSLGIKRCTADRAADAVDFDNSGRIEWSEFVAAMLPASQELFATALLVAFSHFDTDHNGHLDRSEVVALLQSGRISNQDMPDKTVDQMIEELDTNHDGRISFAEFHHYFMTCEQQRVSLLN